MAIKGVESSPLFWRFVSTKTKERTSIDAMETVQGLSFDPAEKAAELDWRSSLRRSSRHPSQ